MRVPWEGAILVNAVKTGQQDMVAIMARTPGSFDNDLEADVLPHAVEHLRY